VNTTSRTKTPRRRGRPQRGELTAPGVPYAMTLPGGRTLFVEVPARMATRDRGGQPAFTPDGVRFLDRVRALASDLGGPLSPALITSLRQAAGMTQEELGKRIGRDKLTVSRWECGTVRPSKEALARLARLFRQLKASGVLLPG